MKPHYALTLHIPGLPRPVLSALVGPWARTADAEYAVDLFAQAADLIKPGEVLTLVNTGDRNPHPRQIALNTEGLF